MCGIIGAVNFNDSIELVKTGLKVMKNRGIDSTNIIEVNQNIMLGHNLHAVIDFVTQPLKSEKGILVINGEIYNYKELSKKYNFTVKNDSELVIKLIDKFGIKQIEKILAELDGVFALAYFSKKENTLVLARDIIGEVPLVYYFNKKENKFAFASEKKAFNLEMRNLNPRKALFLKIDNKKKLKVSFKDLKFEKQKINQKNIEKDLETALISSVKKRIPDKSFALLLSGGIDSYLIGTLFKKNNKKFKTYFTCIKDLKNPADLEFAKLAAKDLGSKLKINYVSTAELEKELPKIIELIESTDPTRVGVASVLYFATKNIKEKVVFSGLGADELFAGYSRFKNSNDVNKDCFSYLLKMYENDLYYQNIVCMNNKTEFRLPFLDKKVVELSLALNPKRKINKNENKIFLRDFLRKLNALEVLTIRKKKAAQYGSNFDKAIEKIAKKSNFKSKADYLNSLNKKNFSKPKNIKLASLLSTGKDSIFAMHLMQKKGHEISCFITIDSSNKDSFMFHTPTIKLAKSISKVTKIPLIIVKTKGEKEKELVDLEKGIRNAIKKYKIEGVVSGALYSNYQRERIEKITEKLAITSFSPLWHLNQTTYLKQVIKSGLGVVITKIACYGLDTSWLGRRIDSKAIEELILLEKKYGINVAGEGGEYETLVVDAPFFNKEIKIEFDKLIENEFTGEIIIKKIKLKEK